MKTLLIQHKESQEYHTCKKKDFADLDKQWYNIISEHHTLSDAQNKRHELARQREINNNPHRTPATIDVRISSTSLDKAVWLLENLAEQIKKSSYDNGKFTFEKGYVLLENKWNTPHRGNNEVRIKIER